MSKVKIVSDGTGLGTHVYVDGVELTSAKSVTFTVDASDLAVATIETYVDEVVLDGVVELRKQPIERRKARK